ncbi:glycosyltransferase [Clostridium sp. MCC353]|uniref:glycosyltransferase family 2 protein n=1 Tax=Clostridium sp. MCC353 TaxID=2592646 RepID=UPI001C028A9C|nr:glycosyltransferase family 2 protein [Clostridium sp. MCC353]MBT9778357.1 glycosyltransferase [Clostridium sp. MCC353]
MKVLMATYQGERYLGRQLDSILGQTVKPGGILISDDLSTDGTVEIIRDYQMRYPGQIQIMDNEQASGGAAANFLRMLSREAENESCREKYFLLSDQDDVWMPDKVEKLLEKMEEMELCFGADTPILVHSDMKVAGADLSEIHPSFFAYQHISPERTALNQLLVQNPVTGGAAMFNRAMLPYLKRIPETCFMHDWWLALLACCFGQIGYVKEPLSFYRQHQGNTLGARDRKDISQYSERFTQEKDRQVKENYRKMFGQAACLLEMFPDQLNGEQKEVLRAFLRIPCGNVFTRSFLIKKYHFYKNTLAGTIAQCFTMGIGR